MWWSSGRTLTVSLRQRPVKHHRLAERDAVALADLENEPVVIFPRQIAPQIYDTVLALCRDAGFSVKIAMEAFPAQSIIALVACGVGLGFIASENQRLTRRRGLPADHRARTPPGRRRGLPHGRHRPGLAGVPRRGPPGGRAMR
jgi:DNA-binding transcriptional LysR family regulator